MKFEEILFISYETMLLIIGLYDLRLKGKNMNNFICSHTSTSLDFHMNITCLQFFSFKM
jgi:hypothetical protein